MKRLFKILIIHTGPEITYLVLGPGITIRSPLSREEAVRLRKQGHLDLIVGPQKLLAGAADQETPEDQAA